MESIPVVREGRPAGHAPRVGILDSGLGGLMIARTVIERMPHVPVTAVSDTAHFPFAAHSESELRRIVTRLCDYLIADGANVIVVGCNTAESVAMKFLRSYAPVPICGVVEPTAAAVVAGGSGIIGVIGTQPTIGSGIYQDALEGLNPQIRVMGAVCRRLGSLLHQKDLRQDAIDAELYQALHPLMEHTIDTLVLGCTAYSLAIDHILPIVGPRVRLVDSAREGAHSAIAWVTREFPYAAATPGPNRVVVTGGNRSLTRLLSKTASDLFVSQQRVEVIETALTEWN